MPPARSHPKVLVVEGRSDKHVMRHIQRWRHDQNGDEDVLKIEIKEKDGVNNLIDSISAEIKESGRAATGFVLDANNNLEGRWCEIRRKIAKEMPELELPPMPKPDGTIEIIRLELPEMTTPNGTITRTESLVGFWLMPDNRNTGAIEDFVMTMVPKGDPVWPLTQNYIAGIPEEHRKFASKEVKAKIYAWLATRKNPGLMGKAIGLGDLTMNGPLCQKFVQWLDELFGSPA